MRFFKKNRDQDALSINMQNEVITISEKRLGKPLQKALKQKVLQKKWSYMGLEMIIDTVSTIGISQLENYLLQLD